MKKKIAAALAAIGIVCMLGAAGTADYSAEVGAYLPVATMLKWSITGIGCMIAAVVIYGRSEEE